MSLRFAKDMPEAPSRLLRYLAGPAAEDWSLSALRSPLAVPPGVAPEPNDSLRARLATYTADLIGQAELWWIHRDLTELAIAAGSTLPVFRCHPDMLPSRVGLMVWAEPVHARGAAFGAEFSARGVAWKADDDGVWLIGYDNTPDVANFIGEAPLTARLGWLAESQSIYLPWRDEMEFRLSENPRPAELHNAAWTQCAVATWLLIGQTVTANRAAEPLRPVDRRRIGRRGHPTNAARIVSLAPRTSSPAGGAGDREYRSRWMVSGHWRQQAWGPRRQLRRPVWIDPYLKGPDGAPLLHSERVHTARAHALGAEERD